MDKETLSKMLGAVLRPVEKRDQLATLAESFMVDVSGAAGLELLQPGFIQSYFESFNQFVDVPRLALLSLKAAASSSTATATNAPGCRIARHP